MKLLVLAFVVAASAAPEGYKLPTPSGQSLGIERCGEGQVKHHDGRCVTPQVNSRIYVYDVPANVVSVKHPTHIPEPKVERNVIFLRLPEGVQGPEPIVIPPPSQQHILYVLNKQSEQEQRVIEVPAPTSYDPEVFFVNYADGENPVLPSGLDLQTALGSASQGEGHIVQSVDGSAVDTSGSEDDHGSASIFGGSFENSANSVFIDSTAGSGFGGSTGGSFGGSTGSSFGGSTGGSFGGSTGGSFGGSTGGSFGGSTGGSFGGSTGGSFGGSTGGSFGGSTGGSFGGSTGGSFGGSTGGSFGGSTGGSFGGSTGGSFGGSTGGSFGGSTGSGFGHTTGTGFGGSTGSGAGHGSSSGFGGSTGSSLGHTSGSSSGSSTDHDFEDGTGNIFGDNSASGSFGASTGSHTTSNKGPGTGNNIGSAFPGHVGSGGGSSFPAPSVPSKPSGLYSTP